jgi:hypothetical protein
VIPDTLFFFFSPLFASHLFPSEIEIEIKNEIEIKIEMKKLKSITRVQSWVLVRHRHCKYFRPFARFGGCYLRQRKQ